MATITDRNAEFKAERQRQIDAIYNQRASAIEAAEKLRTETEKRIADGKLVPLGGDAYRVNDPGSWDNGEVWTLRQPAGLEQPLILPVSNLDETSGKAALYTREPAWHGLGTVVPEGVSDLGEVIRLAGLDWLVEKRQARVAVDSDDITAELKRPETLIVPDWYVTGRVNTDGSFTLFGTVGSQYTPVQNYEAGAFLQNLVDDHGVVFESAGATYGGRHVFIGLRLPGTLEVQLDGGVVDEIIPYLYFLNSHDGTTSVRVTVSPWRVECGNTERFNLRDAVAKWSTRHTVNAMARVKLAQATLAKTVAYFEQFKAESELLARTPVKVTDIEALCDEIYALADNATDRQRRTAEERKGTIIGMAAREADKLGWTAYAAERTFTDYLDHVAPKRVTEDKLAAARATALIEGGDDDLRKNLVHAKLLTLATA